jgi:hypothetical protein
LPAEELLPLMQQTQQEYVTNFLVQRLQIEEAPGPDGTTHKAAAIVKQTGESRRFLTFSGRGRRYGGLAGLSFLEA